MDVVVVSVVPSGHGVGVGVGWAATTTIAVATNVRSAAKRVREGENFMMKVEYCFEREFYGNCKGWQAFSQKKHNTRSSSGSRQLLTDVARSLFGCHYTGNESIREEHPWSKESKHQERLPPGW